ncbi:hypothetical protein Q7P37_008463 [Cladosporium fusiforme]
MGIYARQDDSSSSAQSGIPAPSSTSSISQSTIETATPISTSLPRPFDASLGNNFTEPSCPEFFNDFLTNTTFQECLPFSLLLQTSNSFFATTQSPLSLIRTLDATCHLPSYPACSALMSSLATQLSKTACQNDLSLQNPIASQAYNGLMAYDTLYRAACLTSQSTGNYCYADAVANASSPTSSYVYWIPLGMQLPAGTRPACTECLQDTMAIFAAAAGNSANPLRGDYSQAAQMVHMSCGPGFVEAGVAVSAASSPLSSFLSGGAGVNIAGLVALVGVVLNAFIL